MQMEEFLARAETLPLRDYDVLVTLEMAENGTLRMNRKWHLAHERIGRPSGVQPIRLNAPRGSPLA